MRFRGPAALTIPEYPSVLDHRAPTLAIVDGYSARARPRAVLAAAKSAGNFASGSS
jgi:hypothetical protein